MTAASTERVMMITGGSRGIGRAIACEALKRGWVVSLGVRNPADAPAFDPAPGRYEYVPYDAQNGQEDVWARDVFARYGRIDAVVSSAGIFLNTSIVDASDAEVQPLFDVNVHAPRRLAAAAWDGLKVSGKGRVLVVASLSGKRVKSAGSALYSFSKFAAVGLAHALRHEGWDDGIRATALCPGLVATDMGKTAAAGRMPTDAMTDPDDLARLAMDAVEAPNTLSQAEILVNCQLDERY